MPIRIPKKNRRTIKTIKLANGSTLTFEKSGTFRSWFRDGKIFTPYSINKYRFVDNGVVKQLNPNLPNVYNESDKQLIDKSRNYDNTVIRKRINLASQKIPNSDTYITLNTKGSMNGAMIPTNMLDSIIISSGRSNTSIKQNLGLIGKESTFNSEFRKPSASNFNKHDISNNHRYVDNPYNQYLGNAYRLFPNDKRRDADIRYALKNEDKIILENVAKIYDEADPLADAFARYNASPNTYNTNQTNYKQMVDIIADRVYNEPQIQTYLQTKHAQDLYKRGQQERKRKSLGGDY